MEDWQEQLLHGNSDFLGDLFTEHYENCVFALERRYSIARPVAEDCFMEAILLLRTKILKGNVQQNNLGGYLYTSAKNVFLSRQKKEMRLASLPTEDQDWNFESFVDYLSETQVDYDPLVNAENAQELKAKKEKERKAILLAFENLGPKCQKLLKAYLLEERSLKSLQEPLGYKNYDAIKASKYQCKKALIRKYQEQLEN